MGDPKRLLAPPTSSTPVQSAAVDAWLTRARDALAEAAELPADELELDSATAATLLELARVAARESGARVNAPLLCYLVGVAQHGNVSVSALADAVSRID